MYSIFVLYLLTFTDLLSLVLRFWPRSFEMKTLSRGALRLVKPSYRQAGLLGTCGANHGHIGKGVRGITVTLLVLDSNGFTEVKFA